MHAAAALSCFAPSARFGPYSGAPGDPDCGASHAGSLALWEAASRFKPTSRYQPAPGRARMTATGEADADAALIAAFAGGDAGAFETLYTTHKGGIFRYFLRSLHDAALAEELAQDVWTSVIRAAAQWQPDAKFTTWLYRLAHNRLIDHYRRANLVVFSALEGDQDAADSDVVAAPHEYASSAPSTEDALDQRRAALQVVRLVEALPPAQREALLLQIEGGLTLEEIAVATEQGFETVKSRLRYALAKVRDGMKGLL